MHLLKCFAFHNWHYNGILSNNDHWTLQLNMNNKNILQCIYSERAAFLQFHFIFHLFYFRNDFQSCALHCSVKRINLQFIRFMIFQAEFNSGKGEPWHDTTILSIQFRTTMILEIYSILLSYTICRPF